uniref:3-hexulose-6-phosphate synthase n=1 Tax=Candidatus Kentrum sp. FM TaxID=2126340 RepID=A0A450SV23_9GAMM|nr:MAG: 3-hexulose-6-phosphate synthase/3-hexulose-6-phosphate synthase / 6-phospho-3-hexuloisomerase [Candidatus Kentron sp. FM]VFJ77466.1 MAG: 3-hexulose-6-phosphate synthase/3-hexulose-6-phosphate synthase / 6-phospho-3-hexuloisomerase [Candidatus Kentron sp. FM]VFK24378.1 MAG: 3-hexulose-6-phosphate synthase/3-hexulose-6-phosphate synthase / 6-phospho-3-hexuloisomerase [Candidatus Kentron sp. FM]
MTFAYSSIMYRPLLQIALDLLAFDKTMALAEAVAPYVDILEIGTPCIKYNGSRLVSELRERFPDKVILADLKTMDAGEYEAAPFYGAGADICTVLGVAGSGTISGVVKAAKAHNAEAQVDLINVADKPECARMSAGLGARIIGIHTGLDAQATGRTPFSDLREIASLDLNMRVSVAGGIELATIRQVVETGADIIVVGTAIHGAPSPAGVACKIRQLMDAATTFQQSNKKPSRLLSDSGLIDGMCAV